MFIYTGHYSSLMQLNKVVEETRTVGKPVHLINIIKPTVLCFIKHN